MARILIVDDDAAFRESLLETLVDLGHEPVAAASGQEALAKLAAGLEPAAALLDLRLPGGLDGLELLRRVRALRDRLPVAILTAHAGAANTIEAMRLGAFDHVTKPVGREEVADLVRRMLRAPAPAAAGRPPASEPDGEEGLIGVSPAIRAVQKTIGLVADSDATVLVTGETGTGKELVARAIHEHGRRAVGPFVAVNGAAIPPELLESELFGHARGAFTGAVAARPGAFRDAQGGTLLLDEIGDMSLVVQAKILRVLQERTVQPLGGRPVRLDVRIVAATHRDLRAAVEDGSFRRDLYYRLAVVPIHLPRLRERAGDIRLLAEHFLGRAVAGRRPPRLSPEALVRLERHAWPGNVRELKNAMERVAVLSRAELVTEADLAFLDEAGTADGVSMAAPDLPTAVARLEQRLIGQALQEARGNRAEAARRLGIHRQLLYAKARKHGLIPAEPSEERTEAVAKEDARSDGEPGAGPA